MRPPASALSFVKFVTVKPGSVEATDLFKCLCKLQRKLAKLSMKQREFFAFIFEHGEELNSRVTMRIDTLEQRLGLTRPKGYEFYKALKGAAPIMVENAEDREPECFQLNHEVDDFTDVCVTLQGYLDTHAKLRQELVDCDFTLQD